MTKRKIYIASSWKNAERVRGFASYLRERGHQVFDFTSPEKRPDGFDNFVFHYSEYFDKPREEIDYIEFIKASYTQRAFKSDLAGLDWADTVILMLPSGRSSHLEAGYAIGQGKDLFIYGDLPAGEFDAMYLFAKGFYHDKEILDLLWEIDHDNGTKKEG